MKIFQKKQNLSKNHESLQTFNQAFNSTCWVFCFRTAVNSHVLQHWVKVMITGT